MCEKSCVPEVCSIPHEISIADVMLDDPAPQDDHPGVNTEHGQPVDPPQIIQDINHLIITHEFVFVELKIFILNLF